jgi:alkylated DNA repair protein (DNA oxidative demethylase)
MRKNLRAIAIYIMMKERKKLIYVAQPPEGLFYLPQFFSAEQEREILQHVSAQPFEPYDHHGYKANREVVYYGTQGGYNGEDAEARTEPMPEWMLPLRNRFADVVGLNHEELEMGLVARYAVGAGIGWHRDRPQFGPTVLGISFASDAEMRFRRFVGESEEMFKITLQHGSAYIMSGPARSVWQHGMNPVKQLRYSITFRTIKDKKKGAVDPRQVPDQIAARLKTLGVNSGLPAEVQEPAQQLKFAF